MDGDTQVNGPLGVWVVYHEPRDGKPKRAGEIGKNILGGDDLSPPTPKGDLFRPPNSDQSPLPRKFASTKSSAPEAPGRDKSRRWKPPSSMRLCPRRYRAAPPLTCLR